MANMALAHQRIWLLNPSVNHYILATHLLRNEQMVRYVCVPGGNSVVDIPNRIDDRPIYCAYNSECANTPSEYIKSRPLIAICVMIEIHLPT